MRGQRIALSLFLSIAMLGAACAAPARLDNGLASNSGLVEVQYRHGPGSYDTYSGPGYRGPAYRRPAYPHYRAGHRYRSAPHGWHRYHARPRDWQRRGCIIVGPMWFCP